jgi:hypothetical protein
MSYMKNEYHETHMYFNAQTQYYNDQLHVDSIALRDRLSYH